jgi:hypothetical protein
MLETLVFALLSWAPPEAAPTFPWLGSALKWTAAPNYQPAERAVDNWRLESALNLDLSPIPALTVALGGNLPQTPRCVKLNNYWCIKSAGWNGEIASDADGHVAFASASEGAAVAALLLRRYYLELGRRSARAIITRWAPAQCAPIISVTRTASGGVPASRANLSRMLPQRVVTMGLAPRGIHNTLRARWLSAHGRGGVARMAEKPGQPGHTAEKKPRRIAEKPRRTRLSAASSMASVSDLIPAPTIAVGMGETRSKFVSGKFTRAVDEAPEKILAALPPQGSEKPAPAAPSPAPVVGCASETARIANYAARVAESVGKGPDDDLGLFSADGLPTENLVKVMARMAAVEIGPLRASDALVNLAAAQLRAPAQPNSAGR